MGDESQRDPRPGRKPSDDAEEQKYPGTEAEMSPQADHGEKSYEGSGRLEGLTAIITGGDSGIGRAVAIAFAREGADVAIGYLADMEDGDAAETRRWVEQAGRRCIVEKFDVRSSGECERFVKRVHDEWGSLDVLVNNAAYQMSQDGIEDISEDQLRRTFETNIFGYFFMAKAAIPKMKKGAVILNSGSVTALKGNPQLIDYSATKGAIHVFTMSLAHSLADRGIRVNAVAPGPVWTPLIPATFEEEHVRKFGGNTVWDRPAQPAEIAPAFVFLASTDARYITGEVLGITGEIGTR